MISSLISTSPSKLDLEGIAAESENSRKAIKCLSSPGFFQLELDLRRKYQPQTDLKANLDAFITAVCGLPAVKFIFFKLSLRTCQKRSEAAFQDMALPDSKGAEKHSAGMALGFQIEVTSAMTSPKELPT